MSILLHHYKELKECISETERMQEAGRPTDSKKKEWSTEKKEEKQEETQETSIATLDGYFVQNYVN